MTQVQTQRPQRRPATKIGTQRSPSIEQVLRDVAFVLEMTRRVRNETRSGALRSAKPPRRG